jgi:hypothetical protein
MSVRTVKAKKASTATSKLQSYNRGRNDGVSVRRVSLACSPRGEHFKGQSTAVAADTRESTQGKAKKMEFGSSETFNMSTYEGLELGTYDWSGHEFSTAIEIPPLEDFILRSDPHTHVCTTPHSNPIMLPSLNDEETSYFSSTFTSSASSNSSASPIADVLLSEDPSSSDAQPKKVAKRRVQRKKVDRSIVNDDINNIINSNRLRKPKTDLEPSITSFATHEEYLTAYAEWRKRRELNNEKSRRSRMERKRMDKTQAEDVKNIREELLELKRMVHEMLKGSAAAS